jgi:hypothetical protein
MGTASEDAARLQANVEQWQALAAEQQGLAIRLEELVIAQRVLSEKWASAGDEELTRAAVHIEAQLRTTYDEVLSIQEAVLRRIAGAVSDIGRVLRAH